MNWTVTKLRQVENKRIIRNWDIQKDMTFRRNRDHKEFLSLERMIRDSYQILPKKYQADLSGKEMCMSVLDMGSMLGKKRFST